MLEALVQSPWLRVPLVVGVALALQTSLAAQIRPFGVAPDLMLLVAVTAGLAAGSQPGAVTGFAVGLTFDLVLQTPFGLSALVYGAAAYAAGFVDLGLLRSTRWIPVVVVTGISAAAVVVYALLAALFGLDRVVNLRLVPITAVVAVVNGLLTPVALPAMRWAMTAGDRQRA